MAEQKPHLNVSSHQYNEDFKSKRVGRNPVIPSKERVSQGLRLRARFVAALDQYSARREGQSSTITEDYGIYVEIESYQNCELPLDSLDTRDFKLCSAKTSNTVETALVFIPEARRDKFLEKITQYMDSSKDGKGGPRNHSLINSIADVRLADLRTFWTDDPLLFPEDNNLNVWWELWLKKGKDDDPLEVAHRLAERINARLSNTSLSFYDSVVVLINSSVNRLQQAPELVANLEEIRLAKETPNAIFESTPLDQQGWADDLSTRISLSGDIRTSVCILDAGVNYNHPLLKDLARAEFSESWDPGWEQYDEYQIGRPFQDHGSKQAGLVAFGDLHQALMSNEEVQISYIVESGRILPPLGDNEPELYGTVTIGTAAKLEVERPHLNRVYSLAVTSDENSITGSPSSWSAEIDRYTFGLDDGLRRLFIISAGNNLDIVANLDYWDQVTLSEIEDPGQSWNALTVGAYTEKTSNDDPRFEGWSPFSSNGDVAPMSRSSSQWEWVKQAPYKPDVVAEGGNWLLSPERTEVSNADVVSLLTTSGRTTGQLFETTADTSSASAQISRQAAILYCNYPNYWPETIRGLIVHSAEWTPRMWERYGLLNASHSPKVAKEAMLRNVGYGVPNIDRALYSASHALTLIAEGELQPFSKSPDASSSADPKLNEMKLYQLPWPIEDLLQLPHELEVRLRVTLSYFIEPSPGRRGFRKRYSYRSHALRFETIRPGQSLSNFKASFNGLASMEDYDGPEGDANGWFFGPQLRTRGSLHSDIWTGSAADLADMHTIAVYPVGGWWKYKTAGDRWKNPVRFSLLVSLEVPDTNVDIYSVIESQVEIPVLVEV